MTDEPERELTPEEDARIRSLLASARADSTVPDDVASRLDSVLAELTDSRRSAAPARRRNTGRWLFGAAAASVAAIALFNLPNGLHTGGTSDSAGSASAGDAKSAPRAQAASPTTVARLSSSTFRRDVRRLLSADGSRYRARAPGPSTDTPEDGSDLVRGQACQPSSPLAGVVQSRGVLLDGQPALLEVFGVTNGSRVVRVISCDGAQTLASARIPTP